MPPPVGRIVAYDCWPPWLQADRIDTMLNTCCLALALKQDIVDSSNGVCADKNGNKLQEVCKAVAQCLTAELAKCRRV